MLKQVLEELQRTRRAADPRKLLLALKHTGMRLHQNELTALNQILVTMTPPAPSKILREIALWSTSTMDNRPD